MYGLLVEFDTPENLVTAARASSLAGYRKLDAYSPFPVEGLAEAVGLEGDGVAEVTFVGGFLGLVGGYFMQWYACVVSYPVNVGGRPLHSWPAFIPITFELTVLGAGIAAGLIGVLILNRLPRLYHPIFNAPRFERASQDKFFLCIEAVDPLYERNATTKFLGGLAGAREVLEVES